MTQGRARGRKKTGRTSTPPSRPTPSTDRGPTLRVATLSEAFLAPPEERARYGMPRDDGTPMSVVIEINLFYEKGLGAAGERFREVLRSICGEDDPLLVADTYYRCNLSVKQV